MDYSKTLNLPKTSFPMKANLPAAEPEILKSWDEINIYDQIKKEKQNDPKYILHDGPPYTNAPVHLGQALNKILKDIVVKYKTLQGLYSPFIPGWDMHGLPNERAAIQTFKINRKEIDPIQLRKKCQEFSTKFLNVQREQFKRMGIIGDWENPYLTLDKSYEATVVKVFGKLAEAGFIYRGLKPVYWCTECETALAEAEVEYKDKTSPSIYVKFKLKDDLSSIFPNWQGDVFVLIWTTTPWTLPGNLAIALNPEAVYVLIKNKDKDEAYILAEALIEQVTNQAKIKNYEILGKTSGKNLDGLVCQHPFLDRTSLLILTGYVTLDQGTGCVHTAPGFGQEDYEAAIKYNLPIIAPISEQGILTAEAGLFSGLNYQEANEKIIDHLKEINLLLSHSKVSHSYAHCWRCKKPIIFRACLQWFVAMDINNLRQLVLKAIEDVQWVPQWGQERISNMVQTRPDWCISRQRSWGVPIPVFYCNNNNCKETILSSEVIEIVEKMFLNEGSDSWFLKEASEILPLDFKCPKCQGNKFKKETSIFDVWFESGVSHEAVCAKRSELSWPVDLYLEGSDQHRGWFQLSLLPAVASRGEPPYDTVLTHGWVLDEHGNTMHKSLGNAIDPNEIINKLGADVLRLFFTSVDYTADIKIGKDILRQIAENYRKIRNTCRFMLANLYDFDPEKHSPDEADLLILDKWALNATHILLEKIKRAYDNFNFHMVYNYLHNFCIQELSNFYLDILKDRLYTYLPDSKERRSGQYAIYKILNQIIVAMFPVLSFTSEEIFKHLPWKKSKPSIYLISWPESKKYLTESEEERFSIIFSLRDEVSSGIEKLRQDKKIQQSNQTDVQLYLEAPLYDTFRTEEELLCRIFKVAKLEILTPQAGIPEGTIAHKDYPKIRIYLKPTENIKCQRCWNYVEKLSEETPEVCLRCEEILNVLKSKTRG